MHGYTLSGTVDDIDRSDRGSCPSSESQQKTCVSGKDGSGSVQQCTG